MASFLDNFFPSDQPDPEAVAQQVIACGQDVMRAILDAREKAYHYFWSNEGGLGPIEKAAALGARAASIFLADYQLCQLLASQMAAAGATPDQIAVALRGVPEEYVTTINNDGTVTITQAVPDQV